MHTNQQSTAITITAWPTLNERIDLLPAAKVKITDAKVGSIGDCQSFTQGRQKLLIDVVEDSRH